MAHLNALRHWIVPAAWAGWLSSGAILALAPDSLPIAIALFLALVVLALGAISSIVLALAYRRFLATWPGLVALTALFGLTMLGSANVPFLSTGFILLQISLPFAYLTAISAFIYRRDISLALLGALLLIGAWTAAIGVVRYGGPANFLIAFLSVSETGGLWWLNTVTMALWCALPPIVIGFCAHLARLAWREWQRE